MRSLCRTAIVAAAWLIFIILILGSATEVFGQNNGGLLPALPPSFLNASGTVAASGRICTTTTGTSTSLATYSNAALTTALPNPIVLDALGRPTTNGTTRASIYLTAASYRIALYAAGTGNTCNATAVGTQIWVQDGVYDLAQMQTLTFSTRNLNGVRQCSEFTGATAGARIISAIADLPSTGGTVDCRGLEGAQSITADPFVGVTRQVHLILGAATFTLSATSTVLANITVEFTQGSLISVNSGRTLTINGPLIPPGDLHGAQIFGGTLNASNVVFGSGFVQDISPVWFGLATTATTAVNATALQAAINSALNAGDPHPVTLPCGGFSYLTGLTTAINQDYQVIKGCGGGIYDPGVGNPSDSGTILTYTGAGTALIVGGRGTILRDFQLVGTASGGGGIQIGNGTDFAAFTMQNISVTGFTAVGAWGARLQAGRTVTASNFYNVAFTNNRDGFFVDNSGGGNWTTWSCFGCSFSWNTATGVTLSRNISGVSCYNCIFQSNGTHGFGIASASNTLLSKPFFEGNGRLGAGFDIDIQGATPTTQADTVVVDAPNFGSGGASLTTNIRLIDTRDVEIRNPLTTTMNVAGPTLTHSGNNTGYRVEPRDTVRHQLALGVMGLAQIASGNVVTSIWGFDTTNVSVSQSQVKDLSDLSRTLTLRSSAGAATNIGTSIPPSFKHAPASLTFGSSFNFDTPDNDAFSFGNGAVDTPFSIVALVRFTDVTDQIILAKYDLTTGATRREWRFGINGASNIYGEMNDDSAASQISRTCGADVIAINTWYVLTLTKSSGILNTNIGLYLNGSKCDNTNTSAGVYTAMENLTMLPGSYFLNAAGARTDIFAGQAAFIAVLPEELTQAKIRAITTMLIGYAGLQL